MIAIRQTGPVNPEEDHTGLHTYEVLIVPPKSTGRTPTLQGKFTHRRSLGLAACLRAAADAVEKQEMDNMLAVNILSAGTVDYTDGGNVKPKRTRSVNVVPCEVGIYGL